MAKEKENRERVYKKIELVGISTKSFEAAIETAVKRASETLSNLSWFEVKELTVKNLFSLLAKCLPHKFVLRF